MQDPTPDQSMYVIVRNDLQPGLQMAQAIHAAIELALAQPQRAVATPNTVVLSVPDEASLLDRAPVGCALFREPDIGDEATAFAIFSEGSEFADLPLAGRDMACT